jgi:hypothetical protein
VHCGYTRKITALMKQTAVAKKMVEAEGVGDSEVLTARKLLIFQHTPNAV